MIIYSLDAETLRELMGESYCRFTKLNNECINVCTQKNNDFLFEIETVKYARVHLSAKETKLGLLICNRPLGNLCLSMPIN